MVGPVAAAKKSRAWEELPWTTRAKNQVTDPIIDQVIDPAT